MLDSDKDIRIRELELECMHLRRDIELMIDKYDIDISDDDTTELVPETKDWTLQELSDDQEAKDRWFARQKGSGACT